MPLRRAGFFAAFLLGLVASAAGQQQAQGVDPQATFSAAEASPALENVAVGLSGHSVKQMLSAFDPERFPDYRAFADQVRIMFGAYDSFRVRYQIRQTALENEHGVALADFELEQIPRDGVAPVRKHAQVRFVFSFNRRGNRWTIVDLAPRGFFS